MPRDVVEHSGEPLKAPRHFSLIRSFHLADFLTLANAACGVAALLLAMQYVRHGDVAIFLAAAAMAPAALAFDILDGRVARARHTHSALGRELDSLADVISFGVAPAALAYAGGLTGAWDVAILVYFVCCGVSRLARNNVTAELLSHGGDKVAYFEDRRSPPPSCSRRFSPGRRGASVSASTSTRDNGRSRAGPCTRYATCTRAHFYVCEFDAFKGQLGPFVEPDLAPQ